MSCEAWKWLAIATGVLTLVGEEIYRGWVIGFLWEVDPASGARRHAWLRRFFPAWAVCGFAALVSLTVYVTHCAG